MVHLLQDDIEDKANPAARLEKLHYTLFGEFFEMAHDALVYIEAMARCYVAMKERGDKLS